MDTTLEANRLAAWLEMVATDKDDGRKKDPKDKLRLSAKLLRKQAKEIQKLKEKIEELRG